MAWRALESAQEALDLPPGTQAEHIVDGKTYRGTLEGRVAAGLVYFLCGEPKQSGWVFPKNISVDTEEKRR